VLTRTSWQTCVQLCTGRSDLTALFCFGFGYTPSTHTCYLTLGYVEAFGNGKARRKEQRAPPVPASANLPADTKFYEKFCLSGARSPWIYSWFLIHYSNRKYNLRSGACIWEIFPASSLRLCSADCGKSLSFGKSSPFLSIICCNFRKNWLFQCLHSCLNSKQLYSFDCRSTMYYYSTHECVLNFESQSPTVPKRKLTGNTEGFDVDYFDNMCSIRENQAGDILYNLYHFRRLFMRFHCYA